MAKAIELTHVQVTDWTVNLILEQVVVNYDLMDADQTIWARGTAIFWRNIPNPVDVDGNPTARPEEWFQLPNSYAVTLNNLNEDIKNWVAERFLV
jgi:hypothetical protein